MWAAVTTGYAQQAQAPSPAATAVPTILAEARRLIDAGQPGAAIEKLQAIDDRANPLLGELLGVAYYHANDAGRAIEVLAPVLQRLAADSLERREAVQVLGLSH